MNTKRPGAGRMDGEKFEKLSNLICRYEDKDDAEGMRPGRH